LDCASHFEKISYDVAQLVRVRLHAWQVTDEPFFRTVTEETLDYVMREMTDPAGGFYSTQDADSEGEEGTFFVWTPAEIRDPGCADRLALLSVVRDGYRPFQVVGLGASSTQCATVPLLRDRSLVREQAIAYTSRAFACQACVTGPLALEQLLCVN
jgi:uncharacterized protein YyaL (SSP411 family)